MCRITPLLLVITIAAAGAAQRRGSAELERAGWEAIRAGRLQEAADTFREATRLEPRSARLMLGTGLVAHLLGRTEEARQHLAGALQIQPSLTEASLLLGQLLYRSGDVDGAIQVYEQALTHAPDEPVLVNKLDAWRRETDLHGKFTQRLTDHFTVLFEGPKEEGLAARAVELLEAAYWRIGTALGAYPAGPTTVVLYTNEQFRDVTRSPSWAAAAFDGRIRVPMRGALQNPRELDRVLSHEFTHALVHSIAPRGVPQWLNEGLAMTFEPGDRSNERELVTVRARGTTESEAGAALVPLSKLERSFDRLSSDEARLAYAQSAVAVQALIEQAGMTGVFNLLSNIGDGLPFEQAFERATFVSYSEFQASWYRERVQ